METSTLVTWPSKLKIGAKSKKGELNENLTVNVSLTHLRGSGHECQTTFLNFPIEIFELYEYE